ncbi:hypothetical protein G7054_g5871 [Neopestalotiopsis clavispora]|nr:hypothetical protein G7054_g5871 [Neopestalotiopsis clavispora]
MRTLAQDEAERHMLACPAADNLKHWSKTYSSAPHLAGDLKHAESIRDLWRSYGLQSNLVRYDVLQNFPSAASLKLLSKDGTVQFEAGLTEDELAEDPTSSPDNNLPLFHGFSANGEAVAELVYANFGTIDDFRLLESKGVSVRGKIVICKYSKIFRGLKVRAAQQYGAAAVIIYTDPQEDGEFTEANGYRAYPDAAEAGAYLSTLVRWNLHALFQPIRHAAWRDISPVAYIYTTADLLVPLHYQQSIVEDVAKEGVKMQTFELNTGHCPHLSDPQGVVDIVKKVLAE